MEKNSKANDLVKKLKENYDARAIERKDFSLKDLFSTNPLCKEYQEKDGSVILKVSGFASKFVRKYQNDNNLGFHTMLYLANGVKTGAFSGALFNFAHYFYDLAGLPESDFFKVMFGEADYITVRVSKVELDGGKKATYNFEVLGGEITTTKRLGGGCDALALPEASNQ